MGEPGPQRIKIYYRCCRVYAQVALRPTGITIAHCPRCARRLEIEGGLAEETVQSASPLDGRKAKRGGFWA